jgi:hypothetical protein
VRVTFDPVKKNLLMLKFGKAPTAVIVPLLDALESAGTYGEAAEIMSSITPASVMKPNGVSFRDVLEYFAWRGEDPLVWDDFDRTTAGGQTFERMDLSDPLFGEHRTDVTVSTGVVGLNGVQGGRSRVGAGGAGAASAHSLKSQRPPKGSGE